jgi:hypothetical protein
MERKDLQENALNQVNQEVRNQFRDLPQMRKRVKREKATEMMQETKF